MAHATMTPEAPSFLLREAEVSAKSIVAASTIAISLLARNGPSRSTTILKRPSPPPWPANPSRSREVRRSAAPSSFCRNEDSAHRGGTYPPRGIALSPVMTGRHSERPIVERGNTKADPIKRAAAAPAAINARPGATTLRPLSISHCTTCHHPGGAGPFSLLTYRGRKALGAADADGHAVALHAAVAARTGLRRFCRCAPLGDRERALIQALGRRSECRRAIAKDAPAPPHYDATWQLGKPDLILKVARPFTLPAGGTDVFRNFILPYPLKETHYIRAMEIVPGTPRSFITPTSSSTAPASLRQPASE